MWFKSEVAAAEIPTIFKRFVEIIGAAPWSKRYRTLSAEAVRNPFMQPFIENRHALELSLGPLIERVETFGSLRDGDLTDAHHAVIAFVAPLVHIYEGLPQSGRQRVQGMLRDGLNSHRGLLPLSNEIDTATHLMLRGFDVTFSDIESGGGFDFLARRETVELEVECKSVSSDFGRKIHRQHMAALGAKLHPILRQALGSAIGGQIVRLILPSRLPSDTAALDDIVRVTSRAIIERSPVVGSEPCEIQLETFDIAQSPFNVPDRGSIDEPSVQMFLADLLGSTIPHALIAARPPSSAVAVLVSSRVSNSVVTFLLRDLKDAARGQFTRTRPGVLVVQFLDLNADDLLELAAHDSVEPANASALQLATNLFFRSVKRAHVHTLVYRSHGVVQRTSQVTDNRINHSLQEQGPTYSFRNPQHPFAADPRYSVFSGT